MVGDGFEPATPARRLAPSVADTPRPEKRRRISGKRPALASFVVELDEDEPPSPAPVLGPSPAPAPGPSPVPAVAPVADPARELTPLTGAEKKQLSLRYWRWWRREQAYDDATAEEQKRLAMKYTLKSLSPAQRRQRLQEFADACPGSEDRITQWRDTWPDNSQRAYKRLRAQSAFLTWNGDWGNLGLVPEVALRVRGGAVPSPAPDPLRRQRMHDAAAMDAFFGQAMEPIVGDNLDPEAHLKRLHALVQALRRLPEVTAVNAALDELVGKLREKFRASMAAWGVEVCPRAFRQETRIRVHAHAYLHIGKRTDIEFADTGALLGSMPNVANQVGQSGFDRGKNCAAGLWYIQGPKACSLHAQGTHVPFEDYSVNALWIMKALQGEKVQYAAARKAIAKIPQNLTRNLESIDRWHRERCDERVATVMQERAERALRRQRPFKHYATVEMWEAQYEETLDRYCFLVLEGPSRLGKTAFVYSLAPAGAIYEMSCAGDARPDLRDYSANEHSILFFRRAHAGADGGHEKSLSGRTPAGEREHLGNKRVRDQSDGRRQADRLRRE